MKQELTPEDVIEMGKMWGDVYLSTLSPEERLRGLKPEERLRGLKPEELVKAVGTEKILKGLSVKEIKTYLRELEKKKK